MLYAELSGICKSVKQDQEVKVHKKPSTFLVPSIELGNI